MGKKVKTDSFEIKPLTSDIYDFTLKVCFKPNPIHNTTIPTSTIPTFNPDGKIYTSTFKLPCDDPLNDEHDLQNFTNKVLEAEEEIHEAKIVDVFACRWWQCLRIGISIVLCAEIAMKIILNILGQSAIRNISDAPPLTKIFRDWPNVSVNKRKSLSACGHGLQRNAKRNKLVQWEGNNQHRIIPTKKRDLHTIWARKE